MTSFAKPMLFSLGLLALVACQQADNEPIDGIVGLHEAEVEILSVNPEMDGNTVVIRDETGKTYTAVLSIPNLGPDSSFDFDHLKPGNRMIVSGETWSLSGEPRLTVRNAEAI